MATIKISDLYTDDSELFQSSESYLEELTNEDTSAVNGGWFWVAAGTAIALYGVLPDAQKQFVNRGFQKAGQALFQPVKVY
jgi:hypothetical protein